MVESAQDVPGWDAENEGGRTKRWRGRKTAVGVAYRTLRRGVYGNRRGGDMAGGGGIYGKIV